jgi:hypothetical protein
MTDPSCSTYTPVAMFSSPFMFNRQLVAACASSCSGNACQRNSRLGERHQLSTVCRFLEMALALDSDFTSGFGVVARERPAYGGPAGDWPNALAALRAFWTVVRLTPAKAARASIGRLQAPPPWHWRAMTVSAASSSVVKRRS